MFLEQAERHADKTLLVVKTGGKWVPLTWGEVRETVSRLSRGLRAIGVEPGDRVVIVSENRPEWLISELAILCARAIAVPAYTTNTVEDHVHIIHNVSARAVIVSTRKLQKNALAAAHKIDSCDLAVVMEPPHAGQDIGGVAVHTWDDVLAKGAAMPDDVAGVVAKAARTDTAAVIHTSGTGGAPRGVMLSHGAILHNCEGAAILFGKHMEYGKESFLSFLPLSHSYEHMAGQFFPMSIGAEIHYAESIEALVGNMAEAKPTIMTAVPRLYETMYARVQKSTAQNKGLKKKLFDTALALGTKKYHRPGSLTLGERIMDAIVDRLVRDKIRARFGGRLKFFVSGGAPLNVDIGVYFTALGINLLQGYGLTESAPLISCNLPDKVKLHTVGPPVANTEVRIADDGEILVRGELVMQGYWGDDKATASVIKDGWLHTGDIGLLDEDGYLQITDRKKDIIVNSGGDNISPQRVEGFLALQPEIHQAMVFGDKRPYLVALLVPDPDFLAEWAKAADKAADLGEIHADPGLHEAVSRAVERVNSDLSQFERVRRFMIARGPFTVENGMMTPSMKIRRHMIKQDYGTALENLYR